jgi:two-component system, chemotaxis family, chemotaxis protein CheY
MPMNILIVDDSAVMRSMILKSLRMTDLDIAAAHQATNGLEGLTLLNEHPIDVVIADINMPVMNGEEMIQRMKSDDKTKDIPVLVISTEGSETRKESLKKQGVAFIHKPFSPEQIRDTMNAIRNSAGRT